MTPSRPYIMRALYEWIVDNECTPYLLVDAEVPGAPSPAVDASRHSIGHAKVFQRITRLIDRLF